MFDYQIVKSIKNDDFLSKNHDINEKCERIAQDYKSGDLRKCLEDSRPVLEIFVNYIYKRLMKKTPPKQLGYTIGDKAFKVMLDNPEIISAAETINEIAKKYHHASKNDSETVEEYNARIRYEDEKEVPHNTEIALTQLAQFLSLATDVINNRITSEPGELKLSFCNQFDKENKVYRVLCADLSNVDNYDNYETTWEVVGGRIVNYHGRTLRLRREDVGKVIVCTKKNKITGQKLVEKTSPIQEFDLSIVKEDTPTFPSPLPPTKPSAKNESTSSNGNNQEFRSGTEPTDRPQPEIPKKKPLLMVSILEAELAKERLKTQEDYDAEV